MFIAFLSVTSSSLIETYKLQGFMTNRRLGSFFREGL